MCGMDGKVLVSEVAARDVQAATSRTVSVGPAGRQSRSFAGSGAEGGRDKPQRQRPSLSRLSKSENTVETSGTIFTSAELRYKMSVSLYHLMNNWFMRSAT